mmetsp:Transcript_41237/g.74332  ORF Transcript_41237/g.74332 Transcript_41237/m.74332 type:complete len:205 (-) Transcript_41237:821-1435(-)
MDVGVAPLEPPLLPLRLRCAAKLGLISSLSKPAISYMWDILGSFLLSTTFTPPIPPNEFENPTEGVDPATLLELAMVGEGVLRLSFPSLFFRMPVPGDLRPFCPMEGGWPRIFGSILRELDCVDCGVSAEKVGKGALSSKTNSTLSYSTLRSISFGKSNLLLTVSCSVVSSSPSSSGAIPHTAGRSYRQPLTQPPFLLVWVLLQ